MPGDRYLVDGDVGEPCRYQQLFERAWGVERERPGNARWGHLHAERSSDGIEQDPQRRVAFARSPYGEDRSPVRSQDPAGLPHGSGRVRHQHRAITAQHQVEGRVRVVDPFEIEFARGDVRQPQTPRSFRRDGGHLRCEVGEHHRRPARRSPRRRCLSAWATGEFEHALAVSETGDIEHRVRHRGTARVDVAGVLAPRRRHRRPHRTGRLAQRIGGHRLHVYDGDVHVGCHGGQ